MCEHNAATDVRCRCEKCARRAEAHVGVDSRVDCYAGLDASIPRREELPRFTTGTLQLVLALQLTWLVGMLRTTTG